MKPSEVTFTFKLPELGFSDDYYKGAQLRDELDWNIVERETFTPEQLGIDDTQTKEEIQSIIKVKKTEWVLDKLTDYFSDTIIYW